MAAAAVDASFTSPTADAQFSPLPHVPVGGLISQLYGGVNGWSLLLTFLLLCVTYDQCKSVPTQVKLRLVLTMVYSQICLEQRRDRRSDLESPLHRSVSGSVIPGHE